MDGALNTQNSYSGNKNNNYSNYKDSRNYVKKDSFKKMRVRQKYPSDSKLGVQKSESKMQQATKKFSTTEIALTKPQTCLESKKALMTDKKPSTLPTEKKFEKEHSKDSLLKKWGDLSQIKEFVPRSVPVTVEAKEEPSTNFEAKSDKSLNVKHRYSTVNRRTGVRRLNNLLPTPIDHRKHRPVSKEKLGSHKNVIKQRSYSPNYPDMLNSARNVNFPELSRPKQNVARETKAQSKPEMSVQRRDKQLFDSKKRDKLSQISSSEMKLEGPISKLVEKKDEKAKIHNGLRKKEETLVSPMPSEKKEVGRLLTYSEMARRMVTRLKSGEN